MRMAQTAAAAKPPVIRWHFAPSAFAALRRVDSRLRGNDEGSGNDEGISGNHGNDGVSFASFYKQRQIELFSALDNVLSGRYIKPILRRQKSRN